MACNDEDIKEFTKNWHEKIRNGELVQCKECWIHCLLKAEDIGKYKMVDGECRREYEHVIEDMDIASMYPELEKKEG